MSCSLIPSLTLTILFAVFNLKLINNFNIAQLHTYLFFWIKIYEKMFHYCLTQYISEAIGDKKKIYVHN
jgi:hypothetical protein